MYTREWTLVPFAFRIDSVFCMDPDQTNIVSEHLHLHLHLFDTCGIIMNYNTNKLFDETE